MKTSNLRGYAVHRLSALLVAVAAVAAVSVVGPTPARAAGPLLPSADPFYRYTGKTPLAAIAPGTVLASRQVDLGLMTSTAPTPLLPLPTQLPTTAEQLLYRTSDELGRPSATVTTIVEPVTGPVAPRVIAYLSFYDSLSGKCDPSYTLQGGDPGSANTQLTEIEQALVQAYAADAVVTVPDFEGESLDWTAGHEAGYGTLDAVRATESYLKAPTSTPVGLTGYSGGSIAADWASELAPTYAKELNIVGVAEGGVPVDFAHNLTYIDGTPDWSGIIPAVLDTLSHVYGINLATYLSPLGMTLTKRDLNQCIGQFIGTTPGLKVAQLLKPQYTDFLQIPAFASVVNKLLMGSVAGHPVGPLFLAVGNDPARKQGQGDDIMVTDDVRALAHEYCKQGVPVSFTEYANNAHSNAALRFEPDAIAFLQQRLAGVPFSAESCDAIGVGNSLAPLTIRSTSSASTQPPAQVRGTRSTTGRGELAFTGTTPAVAGLAALLLAAGAGGLVLRRRR